MIIENAYHGILGGSLCKPNGRVDQLEDRYLGMVEAPSSNLGTSTTFYVQMRLIFHFACSANHQIPICFEKIMAGKTIDIIIDAETGKISIHVDGYEMDICEELARKLAGNNTLVPAIGDISGPIRSTKSKSSQKNQQNQKEELKNE